MKKTVGTEAARFNITADLFGYMVKTEGDNVLLEDEEKDRNQVTPQKVMNALPSYTIRKNGAYTQINCFCGICYVKYNIGDKVISLPCQHTFHYYCIENWLKWVKPTCPIDKKSVIRRQYREDVVNERRNRLLQSYTLNDSVLNEENSLSSDDEKDDLNARIHQKTLEDKQRYKKEQSEFAQECTSKIISPLKQSQDVASQKHKNDNMENFDNQQSAFISPKIQQLQESVDAIRQSISKSESIRKKCDEKFQKALNVVTTELSNAKIQTPEFISGDSGNQFLFKMSNDRYENSSLRMLMRSTSPLKIKNIFESLSPRRIMAKRNLTFGDLSKVESEVNSGWIFKRSNPISFDSSAPTEKRTSSLLKTEIDDKNISDGRTRQKFLTNKKRHEKLQSKLAQEYTRKTISFLKYKQDATSGVTARNSVTQKHKNDHVENLGNRMSAIVSPKFQKLQESVDAIRKNIKKNGFNRNK